MLFMSLSNAGRAGVAAIAAEIAAMAAARARCEPVIGATLPLAEARRAHEMLAEDHLGKIVLVP